MGPVAGGENGALFGRCGGFPADYGFDFGDVGKRVVALFAAGLMHSDRDLL